MRRTIACLLLAVLTSCGKYRDGYLDVPNGDVDGGDERDRGERDRNPDDDDDDDESDEDAGAREPTR